MIKVKNIKKSRLLKISFFIFFLYGITTHAQKVSNISFRQEQSNIIVSYDLETKTPCKVSLYVSTNDGKTWQGPLTKVTGDVGNKITLGSYSITWNVLEEFEELRGDKIMFQVRAFGNTINILAIGNQEWTTSNLNVSKYRNGDIIPEVKDPNIWANLTTGAWCYYNNDPENGVIYGKLYNWYAVNDPRGLVPKGLHIPSYSEWSLLIDNLGGEQIAGGKMKELTTKHWKNYNEGVKNNTDFKGLPGGCRFNNGTFQNIGYNGTWWSSSEFDMTHAWYRNLDYNNSNANSYFNNKNFGSSVRCLRN